MKQGRALSEVLTELQRQNAAKQDFIGPAQAFTLRPDGSTFEIVHGRGCCHERSGAELVHLLEADQAAQILRRPDERVRC